MLNFPGQITGIDQKPAISIAFRTWSRDSHGLYDYECTQTKNICHTANSKKKIIRKKNEIRIEHNNYASDHDEEDLGKINIENSKFFFSSPVQFKMLATEENINILQNKIWYVIKSEDYNPNNQNNQNQNIKIENDFGEIKLNDIIKLGRVKYVVTEQKINNVLASIDQNNSEDQVFELIHDCIKQDDLTLETACKICLSGGDEVENPLVNLCRCSGSMRYIHFMCLKMWMNTKLQNKENEKKTVYSYNMKSFNCEICKTPYPLRFRYSERFFDIIELSKPAQSNYIILESLNQLKDNNNYKSIHVINLTENERIIMGRGHDSDVRINDISVSRIHACISLVNQKILLKDLKSKFGTLSLVQNEIEVSGDKKLSLQIGRTYLEAQLNPVAKEAKNRSSNSVTTKSAGSGQVVKQYFKVEKHEKNEKNNNNDMDIDS